MNLQMGKKYIGWNGWRKWKGQIMQLYYHFKNNFKMIYKLVIYSKRSHSESKVDENNAVLSLVLRSRRI